MANTISEYAQIFQDKIDKQIAQKSTTGWMEANSSLVKYNGGKTVKLAKIDTSGLKDYDRDSGYPTGSATLEWEEFTFEMDRGIKLRLDAMDVDETNFQLAVANVIDSLNRTKAIPEVDMYRIYKAYKATPSDNVSTTALTESNILSTLKADIMKARDAGADPENLVVHITWDAYNTLTNSEKILKQLSVVTTDEINGISTEFKAIDKTILIPTSSARMKTEVAKNTTDGGLEAGTDATQINYIVMTKEGPLAITKCGNLQIIEPKDNQLAYAYDINGRLYYDCFIPDNQAKLFYANVASE